MKGLIKIPIKYTIHNDLYITEFSPKDLKLLYWDQPKLNALKYDVCFNAGFFAYYDEKVNGVKQYFTMPIGNIKMDAINVPALGKYYLEEWSCGSAFQGTKVQLSCNQNASPVFKNKKVSTLVIYKNGTAKIEDINIVPENATYCTSGVPTIRGGEDVDWKKYCMAQGWSSDSMYSTWRNWIAVKNGSLFLISGKSKTSNYVYYMDTYKRLKDLFLDDCISQDGGGSFLYHNGKLTLKTLENRRVNSIGVISG